MSEADTSRTVVHASYAGARRRFCLPIGAIAVRLATHQFSARDVFEPIRLGLEGGGCSAIEATALTLRYQPPHYPIADFLELAASIVGAAVNGVPAGKDEREVGTSPDPATSRSTTKPAAHSGGRRRKSTT